LLSVCLSAIKCIAFIILLCACYYSRAQVNGCTDRAANNYNNTATVNDGSCTYNDISIKPTFNANLDAKLNETSGLIWWNNQVWMHNDSGGEPALYAADPATERIVKKVTIKNATNIDWEDVAQDNTYIYIGDIGNNANGNRRDLKIYKVRKSDVISKATVQATIINFSYNDQTDYTPTGSNHTNFDCEALIAYGDSLFLFSKDWVDNKTRLYKLPKKPGTYRAINIGELNVQGLITGAEIIANKRVIVLTGYNSLITPFIYLLYDFKGNRFFAANKRKAGINQSFLQAEGICATSDTSFYISNERLQTLFTTKAKLQTLHLADLLNPYYNILSAKKAPIARHVTMHSNKPNSLQSTK
jgi:hypothetical protein